MYLLEVYIFQNAVSSSHFFPEWVCFTLFLITVLLINAFIYGTSHVALIDPPGSIRLHVVAISPNFFTLRTLLQKPGRLSAVRAAGGRRDQQILALSGLLCQLI